MTSPAASASVTVPATAAQAHLHSTRHIRSTETHLELSFTVVRGLVAFAITLVVGLGTFAIVDTYQRLAEDPQSQLILVISTVVMVLATLFGVAYPRIYQARLLADDSSYED